MTIKDIEMLAVVVKIKGKVYQVLTSFENRELYLHTINTIEGEVKVLDKPIEGLTLEKPEK